MESPGYSRKLKNTAQTGKTTNTGLSSALVADVFEKEQFCSSNTTPKNRSSLKSDLKRLASTTTAESPKKLSENFSGQTNYSSSTVELEQLLAKFAPKPIIASFIDDSDGEDELLVGHQPNKNQNSFADLASPILQTFEGMFAVEGLTNDFELHEQLQKNELRSFKGSLTLLSKQDQSLKSEPLAHTVAIPSCETVSLKELKLPSFSPNPSKPHYLVYFDRFSDQPFASLHKSAGIQLGEITKNDYLEFFKSSTLAGISIVFFQFFDQELKDRYKSFLSQPNQYFSLFQSPFCSKVRSRFLLPIKHNPADLNYLSTYVSLILAFLRLYHDLLAYFIRLLNCKERNSHFDRFNLLYFSVELDAVKALNGKFCDEFFSGVWSFNARK